MTQHNEPSKEQQTRQAGEALSPRPPTSAPQSASGTTRETRRLATTRVVPAHAPTDRPPHASDDQRDDHHVDQVDHASTIVRAHPLLRLMLAVADGLVEGIYALDVTGAVTYMNPAAERLLGWREAELLGRNMHEAIHYLRPDGTPLALEDCPLFSVLTSGEAVHRDDDIFVRKDGRILTVSYTSTPLVEHDKVVGTILAFSDVSAARHAAQRQAVQYAVSQVLAAATTIDGAAEALLAHIGEGLGWEIGNFWLVDGDVLRCVSRWRAEGTAHTEAFLQATIRGPMPRGVGLPGRAWQDQKATWIADIERDSNFPRLDAAQDVGLRAGLAFPITGPNGILGVIEFLHTRSVDPDDELAQTVEILGSQIGQAFERIRSEEALHAGEARTQAIVSAAPSCIVSIDEHGTILEFNPIAEATFGYTRDEVLGQEMSSLLVPPELREQHLRGMARYLATGEVHILGHAIETVGLHADGHRFPIELIVTRLPGPGPITFSAHIRDITAHKQEEAERQQNLRHAALRANISAILAVSAPPARQAQACAEVIVRDLDVALARIWLLDEDEGVLNLTASAGLRARSDGSYARIALGDTKIGQIALARRPHLTNDVAHDPDMADPEWAMRKGIVAFAGYPLIASDHVVGVVGLFARAPLDRSTLDALSSVADLIAHEVARQRAERDRELALRQERRARTRAEALSARLEAVQVITEPALADLSINRFLPEMLRRVRKVLEVDGVSVLLLEPDGETLIVRAHEGLEVQGGIGASVPVGQGITGRIAATRQPLIVDDTRDAPVYSAYLRSHARSLLGVPLLIEGNLLGVLHVSTMHRQHFTKDQQHLLQLVADRISATVERARLYDAEREAHADALALQQRLALLAEAGSALATSLDYEQTLPDLAWALVPKFADWCIIDILTEEGHIERLALAGTDTAALREVAEVRARFPLEDSPGHPVIEVIASGEARLMAKLDPDMLEAQSRDEPSRQVMRLIGVRSAIVAPLRTREEVFGALTLMLTSGDREYGPGDLALAQEVARRTALAIENARLYRKTEHALHQVGEIADQLLMQATRLDTIIEAIAGPVFVCDATGRIIKVNPSAAAMLGTHVDTGMAPISYAEAARDMFYPDGAAMSADETPLARALRGEMRTDFRFMMRRFDTGTEVQLLASFAPTRDSHQNVTGAVVVGSDISEIYRLERQKDDFLSIASHELKTPLTSLKILAQLTQRRLARSGAAEQDQIRDMGHSISRMERLVNDLLDVTRIQSGKLALRPETCDVVALLRQVVKEQRAATEREIRVETPDTPILVVADAERLGQVFTNLLSNAAKYSPAESPVDARIAREGEQVLVSVHDAGGNISPEAQSHVFERFYRAPGIEVQSGSGVGLGLGLFITREIVERHHGSITVESAPDRGTTFNVAVPLDALTDELDAAQA